MLACPSCGHENPEDARFCNGCGTALSAPAPATRKERKFATALFADLVGSTALAEHEDPEVVQSVVGRTFDRLAVEIGRYEGLLEKFMGDAVLAVFGVPKSHEDDAERAVRAALEMQAILSELNRGFAAEGKPTLADADRAGGRRGAGRPAACFRTAGPDADGRRGEHRRAAAVGRAAGPDRGRAARVRQHEGRDRVRRAPAAGTQGQGRARPGLARPAHQGAHPRRAARLGLEARLIGRDEELTVLKQTFQRVQTDGRPALVTVIGPAGVGKSRLIAELEGHVEEPKEIAYWRRGRCLAYANTSYSALADAVKAQCEIFDDDSAEVAAEGGGGRTGAVRRRQRGAAAPGAGRRRRGPAR